MKIAAALAISVIGLICWILARPAAPGDRDTAAPSVAAPSATTPAPAKATTGTDGCRAERGDQKSGAGVIAAFQYAYYVTRSGEAARKLATPTSSVQPAEALQGFIDAVPPGTTYCLRIVALAEDVYTTVLSELRPGQQPAQFAQTVTTRKIGDNWFVDVFK
ncbi:MULTISPECIES: hypothetical protein [unclassified Nocardia]|uniref:hypothetical protein n=1 Tax=unclassified Nocardia TaxID=2637762 RepID=UPI001CE3C37B|nr:MULTISPECIES: hypothetical protein [unclassified Nocardia]